MLGSTRNRNGYNYAAYGRRRIVRPNASTLCWGYVSIRSASHRSRRALPSFMSVAPPNVVPSKVSFLCTNEETVRAHVKTSSAQCNTGLGWSTHEYAISSSGLLRTVGNQFSIKISSAYVDYGARYRVLDNNNFFWEKATRNIELVVACKTHWITHTNLAQSIWFAKKEKKRTTKHMHVWQAYGKLFGQQSANLQHGSAPTYKASTKLCVKFKRTRFFLN